MKIPAKIKKTANKILGKSKMSELDSLIKEKGLSNEQLIELINKSIEVEEPEVPITPPVEEVEEVEVSVKIDEVDIKKLVELEVQKQLIVKRKAPPKGDLSNTPYEEPVILKDKTGIYV